MKFENFKKRISAFLFNLNCIAVDKEKIDLKYNYLGQENIKWRINRLFLIKCAKRVKCSGQH